MQKYAHLGTIKRCLQRLHIPQSASRIAWMIAPDGRFLKQEQDSCPDWFACPRGSAPYEAQHGFTASRTVSRNASDAMPSRLPPAHVLHRVASIVTASAMLACMPSYAMAACARRYWRRAASDDAPPMA